MTDAAGTNESQVVAAPDDATQSQITTAVGEQVEEDVATNVTVTQGEQGTTVREMGEAVAPRSSTDQNDGKKKKKRGSRTDEYSYDGRKNTAGAVQTAVLGKQYVIGIPSELRGLEQPHRKSDAQRLQTLRNAQEPGTRRSTLLRPDVPEPPPGTRRSTLQRRGGTDKLGQFRVAPEPRNLGRASVLTAEQFVGLAKHKHGLDREETAAQQEAYKKLRELVECEAKAVLDAKNVHQGPVFLASKQMEARFKAFEGPQPLPAHNKIPRTDLGEEGLGRATVCWKTATSPGFQEDIAKAGAERQGKFTRAVEKGFLYPKADRYVQNPLPDEDFDLSTRGAGEVLVTRPPFGLDAGPQEMNRPASSRRWLSLEDMNFFRDETVRAQGLEKEYAAAKEKHQVLKDGRVLTYREQLQERREALLEAARYRDKRKHFLFENLLAKNESGNVFAAGGKHFRPSLAGEEDENSNAPKRVYMDIEEEFSGDPDMLLVVKYLKSVTSPYTVAKGQTLVNYAQDFAKGQDVSVGGLTLWDVQSPEDHQLWNVIQTAGSWFSSRSVNPAAKEGESKAGGAGGTKAGSGGAEQKEDKQGAGAKKNKAATLVDTVQRHPGAALKRILKKAGDSHERSDLAEQVLRNNAANIASIAADAGISFYAPKRRGASKNESGNTKGTELWSGKIDAPARLLGAEELLQLLTQTEEKVRDADQQVREVKARLVDDVNMEKVVDESSLQPTLFERNSERLGLDVVDARAEDRPRSAAQKEKEKARKVRQTIQLARRSKSPVRTSLAEEERQVDRTPFRRTLMNHELYAEKMQHYKSWNRRPASRGPPATGLDAAVVSGLPLSEEKELSRLIEAKGRTLFRQFSIQEWQAPGPRTYGGTDRDTSGDREMDVKMQSREKDGRSSEWWWSREDTSAARHEAELGHEERVLAASKAVNFAELRNYVGNFRPATDLSYELRPGWSSTDADLLGESIGATVAPALPVYKTNRDYVTDLYDQLAKKEHAVDETMQRARGNSKELRDRRVKRSKEGGARGELYFSEMDLLMQHVNDPEGLRVLHPLKPPAMASRWPSVEEELKWITDELGKDDGADDDAALTDNRKSDAGGVEQAGAGRSSDDEEAGEESGVPSLVEQARAAAESMKARVSKRKSRTGAGGSTAGADDAATEIPQESSMSKSAASANGELESAKSVIEDNDEQRSTSRPSAARAAGLSPDEGSAPHLEMTEEEAKKHLEEEVERKRKERLRRKAAARRAPSDNELVTPREPPPQDPEEQKRTEREERRRKLEEQKQEAKKKEAERQAKEEKRKEEREEEKLNFKKSVGASVSASGVGFANRGSLAAAAQAAAAKKSGGLSRFVPTPKGAGTSFASSRLSAKGLLGSNIMSRAVREGSADRDGAKGKQVVQFGARVRQEQTRVLQKGSASSATVAADRSTGVQPQKTLEFGINKLEKQIARAQMETTGNTEHLTSDSDSSTL